MPPDLRDAVVDFVRVTARTELPARRVLEDLTVEIARRGLGDESPSSVLHFEAKGSLVGSTLTLFPGYSFLDGSQLPSPIVSRAQ